MSPSVGLGPLLCAAVAAVPSALRLLALSAAVAVAQDSLLIDCYRFDGGVSTNNTKCPNSNACCGPRATCLSNRLCANPGDGPNLWVRGPCAVKGWDDSCAQICLYNETRGGVFPRVTPCSDGSLCCNSDPQCCQNGNGIFLDENGNQASARATAATTSYPPVDGGLSRFTLTPSTSRSSSSSTTTTTAAAAATSSATSSASTTSSVTPSASATISQATDAAVTTSSTPSPSSASASSSSPDDSTGLKVGLGLGIPLAVIVTALVMYLFFRKRGRGTETAAAVPPAPYQPESLYTAASPAAAHPTGYMPVTAYGTMPKPPPDYPGRGPTELMGQSASELDGNGHPQGTMGRYELSNN